MAQTAVQDVVIWAKHIHGADGVRDRILALDGGEAIDLVIDGWRGPWVRMKDGADGRPTPGLRPVGRTRRFWSELFATRNGDMVPVELATPATEASQERHSFREAARAALLRGLSGYSSQEPNLARDDLYDRAADREGL